MALINKLSNAASITYNGSTLNSNSVDTLLLVIPLIVKSVDKLTAAIGEKLTYTVTITNVGLTTITNLPFSDILPAGSTYVDSSFTLNGSAASPTVTGNTLTYTIPTIGPLGVATLQFQVTVVGGEA